MSQTIRAVFDGSVLRPEEPVVLERDKRYIVTVEEDVSHKSSRPEPEAYPLSTLLGFSTDLGVADLAEHHDEYARRR